MIVNDDMLVVGKCDLVSSIYVEMGLEVMWDKLLGVNVDEKRYWNLYTLWLNLQL